MMIRRVLLMGGAIVGLVFATFLILSAITFVRPKDLTLGRLLTLEFRIRKYVTRNGVLPRTLAELPEEPRKDNSICDGWGHDILYTVSGATITLASYGRDGVPGGADDNADVIHEFAMDVAECSR